MEWVILNPGIGTTDYTDYEALGAIVMLTLRVSNRGAVLHPEIAESVSSV
jgi:hypothetical protein